MPFEVIITMNLYKTTKSKMIHYRILQNTINILTTYCPKHNNNISILKLNLLTGLKRC